MPDFAAKHATPPALDDVRSLVGHGARHVTRQLEDQRRDLPPFAHLGGALDRDGLRGDGDAYARRLA